MLKNKIITNASWIVACRIVQSILGLAINMLAARYLGPSNYGIISYAASIVAFFVPIMQLGLNQVLVQETIQHPNDEGKIFGSAILMSACSSIACILGVVSFAHVANPNDKTVIITCALYSSILFCQAFELIQYWFQAKYLSKYVSVVSLLAYAIVSIYKFILLASHQNIYWFAISNTIDYLIIAIALLIIFKRLGGQKLAFSPSTAKRMFSVSKYYIISSLMVTVFAQTDKIMLSLMINEETTGYYSAAVSCATVTSFVFGAIIDSMRPQILESKQESDATFEQDMRRLCAVIIYLSLVQCICITLLAKPIINILYGSQYSPAVEALQIIVWYTTFSYLGPVRNIWILAQGKQRYMWIINLSGAVANVLLNSLLIPYFGLNGAAFASVITQIFTNFVLGFIIKPIRGIGKIMLESLNIGKVLKDSIRHSK